MFLKNVLKQTWNTLSTKLETQWRDRGSSFQVRIILRVFSHIIALILCLNSVKVLRVHRNVKEIKFQGILDQLKSKKVGKDNNSQIISN